MGCYYSHPKTTTANLSLTLTSPITEIKSIPVTPNDGFKSPSEVDIKLPPIQTGQKSVPTTPKLPNSVSTPKAYIFVMWEMTRSERDQTILQDLHIRKSIDDMAKHDGVKRTETDDCIVWRFTNKELLIHFKHLMSKYNCNLVPLNAQSSCLS